MMCWKFIKRSCFCFKKSSDIGNINLYHEIAKKNYDEYLKSVEYKDTVRFIPPIVHGKVIKVYDGDTITIASKLPDTNFPIYRFSVRFRGIDSAEIKGVTEKEKSIAIMARDKLHELIYGKIVTLKNLGTEKYGRVLADVYLDNLFVNKWMLDNHYAVPYEGGKKQRPLEWENEL